MRCGIAATQAHVVVHDDHDGHHGHHGHDRPRPASPVRRRSADCSMPPTCRPACATVRIARSGCSPRSRVRCIESTPTTSSSTRSARSTPSSTSSVRVRHSKCSASTASCCSPITLGQGTVRAAHGDLPNPAPAVVELLARRQAPSRGVDDHRELATPTGVALMTALADEFGRDAGDGGRVGRLRRRNRRHRRPAQRGAGRGGTPSSMQGLPRHPASRCSCSRPTSTTRRAR